MQIILMGTSSWVLPIFERVANEHTVTAVFTRAPAPVGRKKILTPSPVHEWANGRNISVYTDINELKTLPNPDAIVVASYGVILRDWVLEYARLGCINVHPSLLPKYRGPSPMLTPILNGDTESGVCLIQLAAEIDAGDIFMCEKFPIAPNDTIADVEKTVGNLSANMVSGYLANPEKYPAHAQIGEPTFCRKFTGDDEWIDWNKTSTQIHNQIRSIGGRTRVQIGDDIVTAKILETIVKNDGTLEIIRLQPAGKNPMSYRDFQNGTRGKEIKFLNKH